MSIAAQILLARRKLENWLLWILVDMVAIGLYSSRDLQLDRPRSTSSVLVLLSSSA